MRYLLVPCLSLVLSIASAFADDIVVYRGTWRLTTDAQDAPVFAPTLKAYLIVNYTTGETNELVYFSKNGKKAVAAGGPLDMTRVTLPKGKTATVFVNGNREQTSPTDFSYDAALYRGTDTSLVVETSPARRTILRPRSFLATYHRVDASPGVPSRFLASTMTYSLDAAKTIAANNADKSLSDVTTEIEQLLISQGYTGVD